MSDEINAGNAGGAISDDDLLTIISNPGDYNVEVVDGARLEAQLRGLVGRFDDAEYKTITPDGREHTHLDVVTLKGLYLSGFLNRESPVFVASQNQWLPLAQVFDVSRWQATGEVTPPSISPGETGTPRARTPRTQTTVQDTYLGADFPLQQPAPLATSGALPPTTYANSPVSAAQLSGLSAYSEYKGVGGWLAFFIVWQLACRPLSMCGAMMNGTTNFPLTSTLTSFLVGVSHVLNFGTFVFGVIVGVSLLRSTDASVVELTKKYLIALLGVTVFDILLIALTDLPWFFKGPALGQAFSTAFITGIYVLIWYQYFTKSKRVQATYLEEDEQGGSAFTTIGLSSKQP
ncbi:MAG TPA: DUF2569 family protein [Pyrinomonadaceae bacterium]|nr:DUF2569 family protein [Pyrinomonadaceae bacterium]